VESVITVLASRHLTAQLDAGRFDVAAGRLVTHAGLALDAPKRPAEEAKRFYLLSFLFAQDVGHSRRRTIGPPPS